MALRFEHRDTDIRAGVVDLVWRTRSDAADTMTSAARTCPHLILSRTRGRLLAGLRGPETRASAAPVPPDTEFLGVRLAFGTVLRPFPAAAVVDGYVPFPVTDAGRIVLGGQDWEAPTYDNVEHFVRRLLDAGLLVRSRLGDEEQDVELCGEQDGEQDGEHGPGPAANGPAGPTLRTLQRRYRAITGLSRTAVTQIDRANAAATMLRDGRDWRTAVETLGYYDQAHLAHALRRYVRRTARELQAGGPAAMSFLYKTRPGPGS
ncbi:hypothetical protein MF672_023460 [Actinomadura sp. ATCC 31491]|uniref:Helix-turn-helix domain-containing protein n=1 Tax=Actinomadura luzonensis TaxID=2805427 RepID=A0ABT0FWT6_9ACTN|nr:hypothetical protein [Actinomadura luzonensis]MCK2216734.1 hypothetical protein [Actinomadura luzonensis]